MKRQRRRRRVVCPAMRISPINTLCYANQAPRRPAAIGCGGESLAEEPGGFLFSVGPKRREAPHVFFFFFFFFSLFLFLAGLVLLAGIGRGEMQFVC